MTVYEQVKLYTAIMTWLSECYEFFLNTENPQKAAVILEATQQIGHKVLDLCLSYAVESDEIIPRFRFSEVAPLEIPEIIKTLTRFADSEQLKAFAPEAAGLLATVALETLRAQRVNEHPTEVYDLNDTLKGIK